MKKTKFNEFAELLKEKLNKKLGEDAKIDIHKTVKNNGVVYQALTILEKDHNVSPNIRLDGYFSSYLEGISLVEIAEEILNIYHNEKNHKIDISFFTDFEKAKEHIMFRVVSYEQNKEHLKDVPHIKFLDLALTFYYQVDGVHRQKGQASIQIEKEHLEMWKIDEGMLYDLAMENTTQKMPAVSKPMCEVILQIMAGEGIEPDEEAVREFKEKNEDIPMFVLSNEKSCFGASTIYYPGVLKKLAEGLKSDLIVLPSSIHEVILLPVKGKEEFAELNEMITDINNRQVAEEEILSDHLYYYDMERDELRIPEFG